MSSRSGILSTADERRPGVAAAALRAFAHGGYRSTTVADVAREARISPAYVFKLFPSKESLFVAALELCYSQVLRALQEGADGSEDQTPAGVLDAMGGAYAELIGDRTLLMLQVHAQSVADIPEIGSALRTGLAQITDYAKRRTGAEDDDVQRFVAYGQLCHLIATAQIDESDAPWARLLARGIRHP